MNDELKTKQAGNTTYTLSNGDTVLTLNHPALRAPVKMGDEGFRRGNTLTEATTELIRWAVTKDGKAVRVGTRNADVLAWLRANWKVTKDWDDTMPEGVKAYRDWEEANARDREAFEYAMRRGDGRLPVKTAGEKPELTEEDEAWDSVDRARRGKMYVPPRHRAPACLKTAPASECYICTILCKCNIEATPRLGRVGNVTFAPFGAFCT